MVPKLYTCEESGNSYKVRLLASILGIELELIEFEFPFRSDQLYSQEYLAINPRSTIPALVDVDNDDHRIFTDSAAILVYLAGTHPDRGGGKTTPSSFWSVDPVEQAEMVDWLAFGSGWIQNGVMKARGIVSFHGPAAKESRDSKTEMLLADATAKGKRSLDILEKRLQKEDWLACGRCTIADMAIFPYIALAPMGDIFLDDHPAVRAWIDRIKSMPGFIKMPGLDDPMYRRRG